MLKINRAIKQVNYWTLGMHELNNYNFYKPVITVFPYKLLQQCLIWAFYSPAENASTPLGVTAESPVNIDSKFYINISTRYAENLKKSRPKYDFTDFFPPMNSVSYEKLDFI